MAKVLCAYSSIEFQCEYLPIPLHSREAVHPIFYIDHKRLLHLLSKWSDGQLPSTESYLLFLSLLNSTDRIDWRVPAIRTLKTDSIVANNMEPLARIVTRVHTITDPKFNLPHFVISQETKTLDNVNHWIESWHNCYVEFLSGNREAELRDKIIRREQALERLIKDKAKNRSNYVKMIADWASDAGQFPTFNTTIDGIGTLPLSDYWKSIITKCLKDEAIFSIPRTDLEELIEHCEDKIEHGTIYAHALMDVLRTGLSKQKNYLGLGDLDISGSSYRILDANASVEQANLLAMIDSAPIDRPKPENYPSKLAYIKAKVRFEMAQKYKIDSPINDSINNVGEIGDNAENI